MGRNGFGAIAAFFLVLASAGASAQCIAAPLSTGNIYYFYGFEGGADGFVLTGLWHVENNCAVDIPEHSTEAALYFGAAFCNYGTDNHELGTATSPSLLLPFVNAVVLSFDYYLETDQSGTPDTALVELSTDGANFVTLSDNSIATPLSDRLCDGGGVWRRALGIEQ